MAENKPAQKSAKKSGTSTGTGKSLQGFTDEERAAMRERVQALKAARYGPRTAKADGESAVLAKLAAMPAPDRALGLSTRSFSRQPFPSRHRRLGESR